MKQETLKLKPEFIGDSIYDGFEQGPSQMNGQKGNYIRHKLFNEKHGVFHVITSQSAEVIPQGATVKVENPLLFIDYSVNGRNVEPAKNVWAEKIVVVR